MRRRSSGAVAVGLLLCALVAAPTPATSAIARPNVVVILTDDMRWDEMENMPNVSSLLETRGVTFTQAYVPNSLCCPSRATTLTGQFSSRNGVWNNAYSQASPYGGFKAFKPHEGNTLAVWLHNAGYRTGLVGKYLNQYTANAAKTASDPTGLQPRRGWDYWHAFINPATGSEPPAYYGYTLDEQGVAVSYGSSSGDYSTTVLGDDAVQFVQSTPTGQPFFLYFTPYGPHTPFTPAPGDTSALPNCTVGQSPPGCYKRMTVAAPGGCPVQTGLPPFCSENIDEQNVSDKPAWVRALPVTGLSPNTSRKLQEQTLLSVDRAVGDLVDAVTARGELSTTMFVFTSDNSLSDVSHRWTEKETAWEEAIHVPMVVRYDPLTAGLSNRVESTHMVLNSDLAPTVLDLTGVTAPPGYPSDGRSWLPLVASPNASVAWRTAFPLEHLQKNATTNPPSYCGVRTKGHGTLTGQWKYIRYVNGETELYNLNADPFELRSLSSNTTYAAQLQTLDALARNLCNPPPPGYTWPS
jgi:N-acetylglucosamine-6-sulfatase